MYTSLRVSQPIGDVPCDRLAFAVWVRRKIDIGFVFGRRLDAGDNLGLGRDDHVFRLEPLFDVDPEFAFGQIHDMSHRGFDNIIFA